MNFHIPPIIWRNFPKLKDINKQFTELSFYREEVIPSLHLGLHHSPNCCYGFFHLCSHWLTSWKLSSLVVLISLEGHRILLHREQTSTQSQPSKWVFFGRLPFVNSCIVCCSTVSNWFGCLLVGVKNEFFFWKATIEKAKRIPSKFEEFDLQSILLSIVFFFCLTLDRWKF